MQFSAEAIEQMKAQGLTDRQIEALRKRYTAADEQAALDDIAPPFDLDAEGVRRWRQKFLSPVL